MVVFSAKLPCLPLTGSCATSATQRQAVLGANGQGSTLVGYDWLWLRRIAFVPRCKSALYERILLMFALH